MKKAPLILVFVGALVVGAGVSWLLSTIIEHRREDEVRFLTLVEIRPEEPHPGVWGRNFPNEYDLYMKTMKTSELTAYSKYGRYGGSEAFSRLDKYPNLRRLFAGYSFAVEYGEDRGHMNALADMLKSKRMGDAKPGACMTCKSSQVPGLMTAIGPTAFYGTSVKDLIARYHITQPISCNDCHDARTMNLRVTRPAFKEAMALRGVDVTRASRQQLRAYVCGQCHTEYYFKGEGKYLTLPWSAGFSIEQVEAYYDRIGFKDWEHGETRAPLVKIQHPEFELWSSGIHARSGVTCADCHMPYIRTGSVKMTDHWIRTPLANPTNACGTCHPRSEEEMRGRVIEIQDRTFELLTRAEAALVAAQDAIVLAMAKGVPDEKLAKARRLHRRAFIRWDFISAENSMGFHSPQESARLLGDAIDFARQAELAAYKAMAEAGKHETVAVK